MSLGGIIILALLITVIVIGMKVRGNSAKLKELDEILSSEPVVEPEKVTAST